MSVAVPQHNGGQYACAYMLAREGGGGGGAHEDGKVYFLIASLECIACNTSHLSAYERRLHSMAKPKHDQVIHQRSCST